MKRTIRLISNPLAGYDDWIAFVRSSSTYRPGPPQASALAETLGVFGVDLPEITRGAVRTTNGVVRTELSWNVGFGPRTSAWLLRPEGAQGALPGILALHCHGGNKWVGAEQLVDLGFDSSTESLGLRNEYYAGLAPASELALRGYSVLAHDAFSWGSRRFPLEEWGEHVAYGMNGMACRWRESGANPSEAERYNAAARFHEDTVAKAAGVIGTSFAGTVLSDDIAALEVLAHLPEVDSAKLGCFGFSGGGGRAGLIAALDNRIKSRVISCMMATFDSLTPLYLDRHSWLLNSPGLWSSGEWPEHVASEGLRPLLVQFGELDDLFPPLGMRAADELLRSSYHSSNSYRGSFWSSAHEFTAEMQLEAWRFFDDTLR